MPNRGVIAEKSRCDTRSAMPTALLGLTEKGLNTAVHSPEPSGYSSWQLLLEHRGISQIVTSMALCIEIAKCKVQRGFMASHCFPRHGGSGALIQDLEGQTSPQRAGNRPATRNVCIGHNSLRMSFRESLGSVAMFVLQGVIDSDVPTILRLEYKPNT